MDWALISEVILLGISLSMDALAVSVTDGLCYGNLNKPKGALIPLTFGVFQAVMPLIGFFLGTLFISYIEAFDHYIAFGLLLIIGGKMIFDGVKELRAKEEEVTLKKFSFGEVLVQGIATSIDALAVGVSFTAMDGITVYSVWWYVLLIGCITFAISLCGVIVGNRVGKLLKNKSGITAIIGGCVLIAIGIKILVEGLI